MKSESLDWEHKAGCIEQHDFTQLVSVTLTAHRVSFFLLPAWLELGSRRCLPWLEEDEKMTVL